MSFHNSITETVTRGAIRVGYAGLRRYRRATNDHPDDPDRPWLREYEVFDIPETLEPYPDEPVHQFLYDAAEEHPEGGFHQLGGSVTYPELLADAERLATALRERGVGKGDRVATILPTSVQFVLVDYATSIAGGVHVPNDFLDATDDLVDRLERGDPNVLVGHDEHRDLLFDLRDRLDLEEVILTTLADYSDVTPVHEPVDGATWLPDVIDGAVRDPPDIAFDVEEDVHTLLFTGGTTGRPKGCLLTHRNVMANALQTGAIGGGGVGIATTLLALPLYHAYGYSTVHGIVESGGEAAMVADARDTAEMRRLVEAHSVRFVSGVPTQFMNLVEEELDRKLIAISGSAPLADETRSAFEDQHLGISQGYGLSEMSPTTHVDVRGLFDSIAGVDTADEGLDRPCIGVPLPDTEIRLVDVDSGELVPVRTAVAEEREVELCLNGPQRMRGYLDDPDPFDEDGFIHTGDVVKVDPMGRFYVVDRVKNMINVSGLKVYPEEVDEALHAHPGVRRPATVGVPDPDRPGSELVKVYVEPADEYGGALTVEELREFLDGEVSRQALPDEVEVVEELPLTDIGKVDRMSLEERHETADLADP